MLSTSRSLATGEGNGKLILFGEHAVVWGASALATSLPRGASATVALAEHLPQSALTLQRDGEQLAKLSPHKDGEPLERALFELINAFPEAPSPLDIQVDLHVPPGAGLGSSAALATAIARALCTLTHDVQRDGLISQAVHASEGIFHGAASGIDQAAALGSGLIRFEKGPPAHHTLIHDVPSLEIAICHAAPGASTALMVDGVTAKRTKDPTRYNLMSSMISSLVDDAVAALKQGDRARLGQLADFNHGLLVSMGVSSRVLDTACHIAREAGALGAKLTGAGGGGCVYAIAQDTTHTQHLIDTWRAQGYSAFSASLGAPPLTSGATP